jgi:hypothetical protein
VKKDETDKLIGRLLDACVSYSHGNMTLKQVWYRARGQRLFDAIQSFPEPELGELLFTLANDFLCWHGDRDDIIDDTIREIARRLESSRPPSQRMH